MSEGSGVKKVFFYIVVALGVIGVIVYVYLRLNEAGYAPTVEFEDKDAGAPQEKQYPIGVLWAALVIGLLMVLLSNYLANNGNGENIDVDQAIEIVKERAYKEANLVYLRDDPGNHHYVDISYFTGQVINGDPDGHWYFISLVRDYPQGTILPPDNQCIRTYVMYSRDWRHTVGWVRGISNYSMWEMLKVKLQKSTTPDDLHRILNDAVSAAGVQKALAEGGAEE